MNDIGTTAPATNIAPLHRNRRFHVLWIGGAGASVGLELSTIANPLLVLALTGSAVATGIVVFAETVAMVIAGIPAGVVLDRFDRRRVLIVAEAVRAIAAAGIFAAVLCGVADITQLIIVGAVLGGAMPFAQAAQTLAVRAVVPAAQLTQALTRQEIRVHALSLVGPSLAGILYAVSPALAYLGISVGYAISACSGLAVPAGAPPTSQGQIGDALAGVPTLLRNPILRTVVLVVTVTNLVGCGVTLLVILLVTRHGGTPATVGFVGAIAAIGGLVGTALVSRLYGLLRPGWLLVLLTGWLGILTTCFALPFGIWWYAVILALGLLGMPALVVMLDILIFRQVPDDLRGRTISSTRVIINAGVPLGPILVGTLTEYFGASTACLALAGLLLITAAIAGAHRDLRAAVWPDTATSRRS